MQADVRALIEAALKLPPEARGAIAGRLLDSLQDDDMDPDVEAAWNAEIARRIEQLDSGEVKTILWSETRQRILRAD